LQKRIYINNQIRAEKVRLVSEQGEQLGVVLLQEAINKAKDQGLDLIQVTEKVDPPVCKIMDYGKYIYQQSKKEKNKNQGRSGELKIIRLTFAISDHDLEVRAAAAEKFLKQGDKVKIEMRLRGREKAHEDFSREKIKKFMEMVGKSTAIKIEMPLKKEPRGMIMIIDKADKKQ
jgi:translation initiation factor IF-3